MKPLETVGRVTTRDGQDLVLYHRDGTFQIRVGGLELMSSRLHGSELALAELAREAIPGVAAPRVLIGGLGMGYTLRAALDCFPKTAAFLVAEVFPEVVAWNRGPLAHLAADPLADRRVRVLAADVGETLDRGPFDAILLDVDNGPVAFTLESNAGLYDAAGIERLRRSLAPGGVLAVWSASDEPAFERRLRRAGLSVRRERVRRRNRTGRPRHTIYLVRDGRR
jgi:spermidine synthase